MQTYVERLCPECKKLRKFPEAASQDDKAICRYCKMRESYKKTCLEKYGVENAFQSTEAQEKHKQTCLQKYGVENISQLADVKEKKKQSSLKRYGVENPNQSQEVKNKIKATCLERYGVENFLQSDEAKEHYKATCLEKYGVEHPSRVIEIQEKRKQTCLEKYGVENPNQATEVKEKKKKTCLEHFGVEYSIQAKEIQEKVKQTNLEKYGTERPSQSEEVRAKIQQTNLERYGVANPFQSEDVKAKIRQTNFERYGVESPLQSAEIKNKMQDTNIERYGVKNVSQSETVKEKKKQTSLEHFGVEHPWMNPATQIKIKQTLLDRYGVEHPIQNADIQEKQKQTCLEKYGTEHAWQAEIVRSKIKDTCNAKFGVPFALQSSTVRDKIKATNLKKFGVEYPIQSDIVKEKQKQTCLERYGTEYYLQSEEAATKRKQKYSYMGQNFDSRPELAFYIWCKDHNKNIQRATKSIPYKVANDEKEHRYIPDFEVDGELYELKGDQFLAPDGSWQNPFDSTKNELYESKHQAALQNSVRILYAKDYQQYLDYVTEKYTKDFIELFNVKLPFPYINEDLKDKSDMGLIQHFHKSIYDATKLNKPSPRKAWEDKELIRKVALNRLKYVGKCTPADIRQGFSVTRLAPKISVFNPKLAEEIIRKYLNDFTEIVDPFSGFSGRLLGAIACNKRYFGKDIHPDHVRESNDIIDYKNANRDYYQVIQEDLLKKSDIEQHECLFTCPPYGAKEHWNKDNDEIEKTCDEWIDICLAKYKCNRYIFVVDETEKYKDFVVEGLTKKKGLFYKANEVIVCIDSQSND